MNFIGYKKKKGSSVYYTDNIVQPTVFKSVLHRWDTIENFVEFVGRQPIFVMDFEMNNIQSVASGARLIINDVDTNESYTVFTEEIFNFFEYIRTGQISVSGEIYHGRFKLVKVGKSYGVKLATDEDMQDLSDELPEVI